MSPEKWFPARLRIWRPVRFPIAGGIWPENELYWRKMECRRVHWEREAGMVPLKKLERRLNLRSVRRLAIW